jgi:hypothetical protein
LFSRRLLRCRIRRTLSDRRSGFGSLYQTAKAGSTVSIRPQKPNFFRSSFVQKTNFLCINNVVEIFLRIPRSLSDFRSLFLVYSRPPKRLLQSDRDRGIRPQKWLQRSISDCRRCFGGLYQTAEAATAVSIRPREAIHFQQLSRFSRQIRSHIQNGFSP